MPKKPSISTGDYFMTNQGYIIKVVEYLNHKDVTIRFSNGVEKRVQSGHLKRGVVKNPLHPSVCGVGYNGNGSYKVSKGGIATKTYDTWAKMLKRCYDTTSQERQPTYKGCSVCKEWHNFQNFAEWYDKQPNSSKCGFALDKDLMVLDNKQYGPETCSLVPQHVNNLLIDCNSTRGDSPQGVNYHKPSRKYLARLSVHEGKGKHIGSYETPEAAYSAYKREKEEYIKEQAEKYKDVLHPRVYENLKNWELEAL